jgi:hypothetical protein
VALLIVPLIALACARGTQEITSSAAVETTATTAKPLPTTTTTTIDYVAIGQFVAAYDSAYWVAAFNYARAIMPPPPPKPAARVSKAQPRPQAKASGGGGGGCAIPAYICQRESGGSYTAVNPSSGAGGKYQFMPSTWRALGGTGLPQHASPAEQDAMAAKLWNGGAGCAHWSACG